MPYNKFPSQKGKGAPINFGKPDQNIPSGKVPYSYENHPSIGQKRPKATEPVTGKLPKG